MSTDDRSTDARRAGSDLRRFLSSQLREQRRILGIKPRAPVALLARVGRWFAATFVRELAWQLSLVTASALGGLAWIGGLRHRLGRALGIYLSGYLIVQLRHAITAHRSAAAVDDALEGLPDEDGRPRVPLSHVALPPLMFVPDHVRRERGFVYAEVEGQRLRLDVYRPKEPPDGRLPAVIQVHGGGWLSGSRFEQGIPLLNHLCANGWVGFNIDYRLSPKATWPDHIVDVKRAITWAREHADEHGIDPDRIAITGGSAGGHLTALAGLSANDPDFQPGFESADTSVCAAVPFYGVYDLTNEAGHYYPELGSWAFEKVIFKTPLTEDRERYRQASPRWRIHPDAPPFMVIHGERDTLVPVADARDFARELERVSTADVRYVELPGAEHAFDLWPSVRTARIADAVGRFLTAVVEGESRDYRQKATELVG